MRATMGAQTQRPLQLRVYSQKSGEGVKCSQGGDEGWTRNLRAIREENLKLKAVMHDVTEVNKRWQTYNNDRQIYVQRLLTTIQDQQEQINKMVASQALATPLVETTARSSQQDELARLQRQIERLDLEHGETVQVLKFQVKAHHDDWEAERREKELALQDKLAADAKIRELQTELRAHKLKLGEDKAETDNRCGCCCLHPSETDRRLPACRPNTCRTENTKTYRTSVHVACNAGRLLSRGTTLNFDETVDGDLTVDAANAVRIGFNDDGLASVLSFAHQTPIVKSLSLPNPSDCGGPPGAAMFAASAESLLPGRSGRRKPPKYSDQGVDTQTREDIICPVCDMLFPPASHVKFLDHFGKCQTPKRI